MKSIGAPALVEIGRDPNGPYFVLHERGQVIKIRSDWKMRKAIGTRQDLLAKSIGHKKNVPLQVLDLTAGLCRDSFHFVCLGHQVLALEGNKDIFRVMHESLQQLPEDQRFSLKNIQASDFLNSQGAQEFDIIFFDPMFPEKKKSAKPGKESQLLQVLGQKHDPVLESTILTQARRLARKRVVVKRSHLAPHIGNQKPSLILKGKAVRYDVYVRISS
jgi:16S rRNA (guanine1516-N2)-methyltransferase